MVKKLGFSLPLILALTACGGSSNDNNSSTSGTNGGNQNGNIQCNKGIPSGMAPLGKGLFDQPLYSMSIQSAYQSNHLLEDKAQLVQHTLYSKSMPLNDLDEYVDTQDDDVFAYLLNSHGLFTTSNYMETPHGWPLGYISKMDDKRTVFSAFNDQCNLSVEATDSEYQTIDLSGYPISTLFEDDGTTSIIANDPDFSQKNYKYIESSVADFLNPSNISTTEAQQQQQNYKNMIASGVKFPQGSYVYVMTPVKLHETTYSFTDEPTTLTKLEDWVKNHPIAIQWKILSISNYSVLQIYKKNGQLDCVKDPAILKDGKVYDGECLAADQTAEELKSERTFYMNQTTRDALRAQLKQFYNY